MPGFGAIGEFAIGQVGFTTGAAVTTQMAWFMPLSEPARFRPGLKPSQQQFIAFNPVPVVPFGWFEPLSEPVRFMPGLSASRQQAFAAPPFPPIVSFSWFEALSEPPRFRPGTHPARQQFLAAPAQLRPTPQVTVTLGTTETKDVFLGGAMRFNRTASAEVGIAAPAAPSAEIGLRTQNAAGAIAGGRISISII